MSFGVTVGDIDVMVLGFTASATSSPSTAEIEVWIARHTAIVDGIFQMKGVGVDSLDTTKPAYNYGAQVVILRVVSQLLFALQGRQDQALENSAAADKMVARLEELVGRLGSDSSGVAGSVDIMVSSTTEAIATRINNAEPTGLRGSMTRQGTM